MPSLGSKIQQAQKQQIDTSANGFAPAHHHFVSEGASAGVSAISTVGGVTVGGA